MPKVDKEKRHQARDHLQKGYKFSKEQAYVLIPHERIGRSKSQVPLKEEGNGSETGEVNICQLSDSTCSEETIKETAQHIVQDNLSERNVKAISKTLVKTTSSPVTGSNCLSRL